MCMFKLTIGNRTKATKRQVWCSCGQCTRVRCTTLKLAPDDNFTATITAVSSYVQSTSILTTYVVTAYVLSTHVIPTRVESPHVLVSAPERQNFPTTFECVNAKAFHQPHHAFFWTFEVAEGCHGLCSQSSIQHSRSPGWIQNRAREHRGRPQKCVQQGGQGCGVRPATDQRQRAGGAARRHARTDGGAVRNGQTFFAQDDRRGDELALTRVSLLQSNIITNLNVIVHYFIHYLVHYFAHPLCPASRPSTNAF